MGNSLLDGQNFTLGDLYMSSGIEARVFVPALRVPFRLIFAYNNRLIYPGDSHVAFRFAIGTTF
jgi:outer membrane protein insertion porin family